jgi:gas vesicle protein
MTHEAGGHPGVNTRQRILAIGGGVLLAGAAAGEHLYRRTIEGRYRQAQEARRQLELQFGEVLATHQQLKQELEQERQRSKELFDLLAGMRGRVEDLMAQWTQERQTVQSLQERMTAMQRQMDQLQGELAVALQPPSRQSAKAASQAIQLERVVVSDAASSGLRGRIVSVHKDWNFVVIDLGWDAVRIGDTVSIFRENQLLAKARVERVQEGMCAASLLPEWETAEVHINDLVRPL